MITLFHDIYEYIIYVVKTKTLELDYASFILTWKISYFLFYFFASFLVFLFVRTGLFLQLYDAAWTNWTLLHFKSWFTDLLVKYFISNFSSVFFSLHLLQLFYVLHNELLKVLLFDKVTLFQWIGSSCLISAFWVQ